MQSQLNPDSPVKEYVGVWIPAEVMESDVLSPIEKILYGEIAGFRECYASNAWLANRIGRAERTVKRLISHLIECGYVENLGFNGRFRRIRVAFPRVSSAKNGTPAVPKMAPRIKKYNVDNKLSTEPKVQNEYGNKTINSLFTYWKEKTGITPSNNKINRNACHILVRQRGEDGARKTIDAITRALHSNDRFAPRVSSFAELYGAYGKLSKLDAWEIKNSPKTALKRFHVAQTTNFEPTDAERAETLAKMKQAREKLFN